MLVDSHCHLDFPDLVERFDEVLANMAANDVGHALCVCVTLEDFENVLALACRDARLSASVGVHPDYTDRREPDVDTLLKLAEHPKVVAIGETGLDYFRVQGDTEWQRERFRVHIRAARRCGRPLIIHTRAAAADTLRLMREEGADAAGGVMHCFTEDWATARAALDLGFHLSFSGIVTFKNAAALREVAAKVPDDRLLVETDSPYLAPVPYRGKTNEPAFVRHVAACVAAVRQQQAALIEEITTENYFNLFKCSERISEK
ncbi:MAG: TatD family hydrolase [Burkholderiales bacterium]|nr:TatD family hydrolase [Burkholderiales bacterium]